MYWINYYYESFTHSNIYTYNPCWSASLVLLVWLHLDCFPRLNFSPTAERWGYCKCRTTLCWYSQQYSVQYTHLHAIKNCSGITLSCMDVNKIPTGNINELIIGFSVAGSVINRNLSMTVLMSNRRLKIDIFAMFHCDLLVTYEDSEFTGWHPTWNMCILTSPLRKGNMTLLLWCHLLRNA